MFWLAERESHSWDSIWRNYNSHWSDLLPTDNIQHKHKLLAFHTRDNWNTDRSRSSLRTPQTVVFYSNNLHISHFVQILLLFHSEINIRVKSKKMKSPIT